MAWKTTQRAYMAVMLGFAGCDEPPEPPGPPGPPAPTDAPADVEGDAGVLPDMQENGVLLNSFRLNSFRLNSFRLNSFRLNGDAGTGDFIQIVDVDLPGGHQAEHAWLAGSTLYVETTKHKVLGGKHLKHLEVTFVVSEGGEEVVRVVKVAGVKPLHKGSDVMLYDLEIREGEDGDWEPLCVDPQGEAVDAVLLADVWDPETGVKITPRPTDAVTIACVDAALGKCAVWGYRPWASEGGEPLADYHQACTRMVRADYCGDGVSHTKDGTPIHVLDELGIEALDELVQFVIEAEWAPDGAVCLNPANTRLPGQKIDCALPGCGAPFDSGGLIQSGKVTGAL